MEYLMQLIEWWNSNCNILSAKENHKMWGSEISVKQ